MALDRNKYDGHVLMIAKVDDAGTWTDVGLGDWAAFGNYDLATSPPIQLIELKVYNGSTDTNCYVIGRESDADSTDDALMILPGQTVAYGLSLSDRVTVISVDGEDVHLEAYAIVTRS